MGKAVFIDSTGGPEAFRVGERADPSPGPGEIAVGVGTLERLGGPPPCPVDGPEFHEIRGREEPIAIYKLRWNEGS